MIDKSNQQGSMPPQNGKMKVSTSQGSDLFLEQVLLQVSTPIKDVSSGNVSQLRSQSIWSSQFVDVDLSV